MKYLAHPISRLLRLHQPTGTLLLLWPCLWSYFMATRGAPAPAIFLLLILGAFAMRSAGCVINDLADRELDRQVERTASRPLASGEIAVLEAITILAVLLALALAVAIFIGWPVVWWSALALPLVIIYPWMKRITWWPQVFLGLTFNWGALIGWVAATGTVELPALLLYLGAVTWTIGYDTIYAHQDRAEDVQAGIKSSARRLGDNTHWWLWFFYGNSILCWLWAGYDEMGLIYRASLALIALDFMIQIKVLDVDDPLICRRLFIHNGRLGLLLVAGIWLDHLV